MFTIELLSKVMKKKGYQWFDSQKDYELNIIGVRNLNFGKKVTNLFDDWITLSYKINGEWKLHIWPATTDPGTKSVKEFTNKNGVARLIPNQYKNTYIIRKHAGKYDAVCQDKPVKVWRDKNKDNTFDEVVIEEGVFGINIHRSNPTTESQYVENWSEGCQVFKKAKDFQEFMNICNESKKLYGNSFTYTLLTTHDFS